MTEPSAVCPASHSSTRLGPTLAKDVCARGIKSKSTSKSAAAIRKDCFLSEYFPISTSANPAPQAINSRAKIPKRIMALSLAKNGKYLKKKNPGSRIGMVCRPSFSARNPGRVSSTASAFQCRSVPIERTTAITMPVMSICLSQLYFFPRVIMA